MAILMQFESGDLVKTTKEWLRYRQSGIIVETCADRISCMMYLGFEEEKDVLFVTFLSGRSKIMSVFPNQLIHAI